MVRNASHCHCLICFFGNIESFYPYAGYKGISYTLWILAEERKIFFKSFGNAEGYVVTVAFYGFSDYRALNIRGCFREAWADSFCLGNILNRLELSAGLNLRFLSAWSLLGGPDLSDCKNKKYSGVTRPFLFIPFLIREVMLCSGC